MKIKNTNIQVYKEDVSNLALNYAKSLTVLHSYPNDQGFVTAVLNAVTNENSLNDDEKTYESLLKMSSLLNNHDPRKAVHLWAEEFYDKDAPCKHRNFLISGSFFTTNYETRILEFYKAGDSEIWVQEDGIWRNLFAENMLTTKGLKIYKDALKSSSGSQWDIREQVLDDMSLWQYPTLGLTIQPVLAMKRINMDKVEKVVLSSKSMNINITRLYDLESWVETEIHEVHDGKECNHEDLSLIKIDFLN